MIKYFLLSMLLISTLISCSEKESAYVQNIIPRQQENSLQQKEEIIETYKKLQDHMFLISETKDVNEAIQFLEEIIAMSQSMKKLTRNLSRESKDEIGSTLNAYYVNKTDEMTKLYETIIQYSEQSEEFTKLYEKWVSLVEF